MNLFRYKIAWWPENTLASVMRNHGIDFDFRHEEAAEEYFRTRKVLEYNEEKKKGNLLWRLTIPLWALYWLLLLIVAAPINWMMTGHFKLQNNTKLFNFTMAWHNKVFE